ncbi:MAG: class I SAM-dependent methyltransferase [Cellvibrionaceae bacterium]
MSLIVQYLKPALEKLVAESNRDARRLFHGRGRTYPGHEQVTVDWFSPVIWVTFFKPQGSDSQTQEYEQVLLAGLVELVKTVNATATTIEAVMVQRRYLHNAPSDCILGVMPDSMFAHRGEARFTVQLGGRQNTGFFLDMEPGRKWLESRVKGRRVLNLFSYTCAFSVVAQMAGAESVVNVDMSSGALSQGRENHRLNGLPTDNIRFLPENILKSWGRIRRPGPYDVAIIDPPSYQKGSFVAERDYGKLVRRLPQLMNPGGDVLLCLNAPELGQDFVEQVVAQECPACRFVERLTPSSDFPDENPDQQLKLLHYRYPPDA